LTFNSHSYVADKVDLYKTSLNKYLWYIDLENFKRNVRSITGLRYMRYTYGPVIEEFKYEDILNLKNHLFYKEEIEEDCNTTMRIKSQGNYDLSLFKEEELQVINDVIDELRNKTCYEISNLSHKEDGWLQNKDRDLISYDYADNLKIEFEKY